MNLQKKKILVVIPCFNEEGNIKKVLLSFKENNIPYKTLVIDDGSKDNTKDIATQYTSSLRLPFNLGIGVAVQTGIKYALLNNFDFVIQVDGDGQHFVSGIPTLVSFYEQNEVDIVIGSRFLGLKTYIPQIHRMLGIQIIRIFLRLLYKQKITDPTSGFRLLNKKAMLKFAQEYPYDYPEPISLGIALKNNVKIGEVAVRMRSREAGKSSIRHFFSFLYMIKVIVSLFLTKIS